MDNFFFFNDTATTEIYTLSLHDALPISARRVAGSAGPRGGGLTGRIRAPDRGRVPDLRRRPRRIGAGRADRQVADRKSTRLNSSHANISYAVFCLKKKK